MSITDLRVHPYADKFPMLPPDELSELAESIAANGLRQPIVVTPDGLILDGRNRYAACEIACVEPETVVYEGDDLAEYVIDCNVARRNMTAGARAMATALVLAEAGYRNDGRWDYGRAGEKFQVGKSRLAEAGVILDFKFDVAESVAAGVTPFDEALRAAKAIKDSAERDKVLARERKRREKEEAAAEAEANARIVADLTQAESKYVALIEAGALTPAAAWSAYREDTRKERERAVKERKARSDLYSGIARGLQIIGGYGKYGDYGALMAEYDPAELDPIQYAREFEPENLTAAATFIDWLLNDWSGK